MRTFTTHALTLFLLLSGLTLSAQVAINVDGSPPDSNAILDLKSPDKGFLIPRMSTAQRDAILDPATGLLVFDTTTNMFSYFHSGSGWMNLGNSLFQHDAPGHTVHSDTNGIDITVTDFVFGSPQLGDTGDSDHDQRFFFDKSKGAFRAGDVNVNQWDEDQVGDFSVAFGKNTVASGKSAFSIGRSAVAAGDFSFAAGDDVQALGNFSLAMGDEAIAENFASIAIGYLAYSSGLGATALGYGVEAPSALEMTIGSYPTTYSPVSSLLFLPGDRLFTVGNGTDPGSRSDALILKKSGDMTLFGNMTLNKEGYNTVFYQGANGAFAINNAGNSDQLSLGSNGRVAIGKSIPDAQLHVYSNTLSPDTGIRLSQGAHNSVFHHDDYGNLQIRKLPNTAQLSIAANGSVGIGIESSASKFHVFSTINPRVTFESDAGSTVVVDRGTTSNESAIEFQTDGSANWLAGMDNLPAGNSGDFVIKTTNNGNGEFVLKTNGNVGIGTVAPAEKLHINGAIRMGNTTNGNVGTMRWTGNDFEGFDGLEWLSLTGTDARFDTIFGPYTENGPVDLNIDLDAGVTQVLSNDASEKWQSFTTASNAPIVKIEVQHAPGAFIANGTLRVYAGEGLGGAVLHEQTIDDSDITGDWATYTLTTPIPVLKGIVYTIALADLVDDFKLYFNLSDPYAGGRFYLLPFCDMNFRMYVQTPMQIVAVDTATGRIDLADDRVSIAPNGALEISALDVKDASTGTNAILFQGTTSTDKWVNFRRGGGGMAGEAGAIFSSFSNHHYFLHNSGGALNINFSTENSDNPALSASANIFTLSSSGDLTIAGDLTENSDRRLKKDFTAVEDPLSMLQELHGYYYYWKDRPDTARQFGVIAQEVASVLPEIVHTGEDGILSVNYGKLSVLLIESVKAQQEEIARLMQTNNLLEARLERIEAMIGVDHVDAVHHEQKRMQQNPSAQN